MAEGEILSPALAALLQIMTSTEVAEAKCVEAAKAIIEYEAPQGLRPHPPIFARGGRG